MSGSSPEKMTWNRLLSSVRLGTAEHRTASNKRSEFERDYDRILFSKPFRRLMDKTQVFPMPDNDHIHNRLIHSLEVASVGRSMGRIVGSRMEPERSVEIGDVVASACLMHDLGNPPFGHAGEDAIASWFGQADKQLRKLSPPQREDLRKFEGNAQTFRAVARLHMYSEDGGMRLTHAVLAAAAKYPCPSTSDAHKKFNFFTSDKELFRDVAEGVGLLPSKDGWVRHPLAYLVEAADDLCYHVMDFEDGCILGLIDKEKARAGLLALANSNGGISNGGISNEEISNEEISHLRALAINEVIQQVAEKFLDHEDEMLSGTELGALVDSIPASAALKEIRELSVEYCYKAEQVVRVELAGYEVLGGLLDFLVPAALAETPSKRQKKLRTLIGKFKSSGPPYDRLLYVTDFLAGLTDRCAVQLFRELRGTQLAGVRGVD